MTVSALEEITLGVGSLERSLALYADVLGFESLRSGRIEPEAAASVAPDAAGARVVVLGRPAVSAAPRLRLVEVEGPVARGPQDSSRVGPLGIGFTCPDIHAAHARLTAAGVEFFSQPIELTPEPEELTGPRRFEAFGRAADGELVVLIERRNVPGDYGTLGESWLTSEPLHTSHVVADLAAASRFMVEALGHRVIFRETCEGEEFERLMGVVPGARFRFEMLQHPEHHIGRIIFIEYVEPAADPRVEAPPSLGSRRGMRSLRYDSADLDATLAAATAAGGEILVRPRDVASAVLGTSRVAVVASPIGIPLEIWQPTEPGTGTTA